MHIAVTGASGLIGSALTALLTRQGHRVTRFVRREPRRGPQEGAEARWDPQRGRLDPGDLDGVDAVVNLAGEGIGERRWTDEQKRRIRDSRVGGTRLIAETLAGMRDGPRVFVAGSAIGYYGDRGDEVLTEDSGPGTGFLPGVVQEWEAAADPARRAGVRVAHTRMGVVQAAHGGALARQLPLFRAGLGARLGSGRQWVSWVTLDDAVGVLLHVLDTPDLDGAVNVVAPHPVTNAEYTRTLARVLGRPTLPLPAPRFAPAVMLGRELTEEVVLGSTRVRPERALASGYAFRHEMLEAGLRHVLART